MLVLHCCSIPGTKYPGTGTSEKVTTQRRRVQGGLSRMCSLRGKAGAITVGGLLDPFYSCCISTTINNRVLAMYQSVLSWTSNSSYLWALNSYPQNGTIQISSCITKRTELRSNSSDRELPRDMFRFNPSRITLVGIFC